MMNAAATETEKTNIRVNEIYLSARVDYDEVADERGSMKASKFGQVYEQILAKADLKGFRVQVFGKEDVEKLRYSKLRDQQQKIVSQL